MIAKQQTFNSFQALEFILQPDSDDESTNKSIEDGDFAEDVPKIDGNPGYETGEDGKLNDEPSTNDGGEENCFVYIFQSSQDM